VNGTRQDRLAGLLGRQGAAAVPGTARMTSCVEVPGEVKKFRVLVGSAQLGSSRIGIDLPVPHPQIGRQERLSRVPQRSHVLGRA
jgi:hypothetical protein